MTVFKTENGLKNCDFSAFVSDNKPENESFNSIPCLKIINYAASHLSDKLLQTKIGADRTKYLLKSFLLMQRHSQQVLFKTIARATEVINSGNAGTAIKEVTSFCVSTLIAFVAPFIDNSANSCSAAQGL